MSPLHILALSATAVGLLALPSPGQVFTSGRKSLVAFSVVVLVTALVAQQ